MLQVEHGGKDLLDVDQVLSAETLLGQGLTIDVGSAQQRVGSNHVVDDLFDLVVGVAERGQRRSDGLIHDLEVAATCELLELDQ